MTSFSRPGGGLLLVLLIVQVLPSCNNEKPLGEGHYRWEGIHGFAIWPEDRPEDALVACEEKVDEEPWRGDPDETAEQFLRSKLNWTKPEGATGEEVPEDAPRAVFTMADAAADFELGLVVHLRQLRGCWFIAVVTPREGDLAVDYRWVKRQGDHSLSATWKGGDPINLEVGWGSHVVMKTLRRGDTVTIPTPNPELSGHVLWYYDDPSEHTLGQPLSPPPRIP